MVAGMSRGKKAYLQYETPLSDAIAQLANLREEFKAAADADTAAYEEVVKAFRKVKQDPAAQGEVNVALKQATNIPLGVAQNAHMAIGILESLRSITNPKMASDLTTGLVLARAAREGALANVEINLADMDDPEFVTWIRSKVAGLQ
jgi:formiminotetrahydrofolate cyclodeaminase